MTFSPMPTDLDAAKAEIFSCREQHRRAAAELRRLHAINAQLLEALALLLSDFEEYTPLYEWHEKARAAIAAAKEQA